MTQTNDLPDKKTGEPDDDMMMLNDFDGQNSMAEVQSGEDASTQADDEPGELQSGENTSSKPDDEPEELQSGDDQRVDKIAVEKDVQEEADVQEVSSLNLFSVIVLLPPFDVVSLRPRLLLFQNKQNRTRQRQVQDRDRSCVKLKFKKSRNHHGCTMLNQTTGLTWKHQKRRPECKLSIMGRRIGLQLHQTSTVAHIQQAKDEVLVESYCARFPF